MKRAMNIVGTVLGYIITSVFIVVVCLSFYYGLPLIGAEIMKALGVGPWGY